MSEQNTIAIICDCDGTLCSDTTSLLVSKLGGTPTTFWSDVYAIVEQGWDPPVAYMNKLLELAHSSPIDNITLDLLKEVGESITFFPGVLDYVSHYNKG